MPVHSTIRHIRQYLDFMDENGIQWAIENGSKHFKLKIAGALTIIIPKSPHPIRGRNEISNRKAIENRLKTLGCVFEG